MMKQKKKLAAGVTAAGMAAAMLLTGTFAWQSISQKAVNQVMAETNPGGRLHDDFDGKNKDIYVENFTDDVEGMPIFARVRLREYLETGVGAGDPNAADRETQITVLGKEDANISDTSTWAIHYFKEEATEGADAHLTFHDYITWDQDGGSTVYMPTFNKNKDSLVADINGTLAGPDGILQGQKGDTLDRYQDYQSYTLNQTITGNAIYDADNNDADEVGDYLAPDEVNGGVLVNPGGPAVDGEHYQLTQEEHTAQNTLSGTVISMTEWEALDPADQVGNYWVYDTDGWAYWAAPIMPGTATGLLLDGISVEAAPDQEWYYAIDVEAQFATVNDWGTKEGQDGFYNVANGGMLDTGASVLEKAADSLNNRITISLNNTVENIATVDSFVAQPGDKARFSLSSTINGQTKEVPMEEVQWSVSSNLGSDDGTSLVAPYTMIGSDHYRNSYDLSHNSALLTIEDTVPPGTTLTVTARYQDMTDQVKVQVKNLGYENLAEVIPGSLTTVTIDDIRWYVLAKDNNGDTPKVMLWADDGVCTMNTASSSTGWIWSASNLRTYLQSTFLDTLTTLSQDEVIHPTTLTTWTGKNVNPENWETTQDTVFLLTEADLFGRASYYKSGVSMPEMQRREVCTKDYSYCIGDQGQVLAPDVEMRQFSMFTNSNPGFSYAWLRHSGDLLSQSSCATVYEGVYGCYSGIGFNNANNVLVVRPAMWVNLGVEVTP